MDPVVVEDASFVFEYWQLPSPYIVSPMLEFFGASRNPDEPPYILVFDIKWPLLDISELDETVVHESPAVSDNAPKPFKLTAIYCDVALWFLPEFTVHIVLSDSWRHGKS